MDFALDQLDIVNKNGSRSGQHPVSTIESKSLAKCLEEIAQEAAILINKDQKGEFLYKNPNGLRHMHDFGKRKEYLNEITKVNRSSSSNSSSLDVSSSSTASGEYETGIEPWTLIKYFDFHILVTQINEFIETWELSAATKFVVLGLNEIENKAPFGNRYFVEALFSKPTPKCPNPLAVSKVYFQINVSLLLPKEYPVNVTYKFEGYENQFYAMGKHKVSSNKFQRYYIDSILHMKLAFYAKLCECRNPLNPILKRKQSGEFFY